MPLLTRPAPAASLVSHLAGRARPEHLALGRAGVGAVMVVRPRTLPQGMGVDSAASARTSWVVQMLGAREIGLGLGTYAALRSGDRRAARLWLMAGVLSDAVDALAVGAAVAQGRVSRASGALTTTIALSATAIGLRDLRADEADVQG